MTVTGTDYLQTNGATVVIAGDVTGSGTLWLEGGGHVVFADLSGFSGSILTEADGTTCDTTPHIVSTNGTVSAGAWNAQDVIITENAMVTLSGVPSPNIIYIDSGATLYVQMPGPGPYDLACPIAGSGTFVKSDNYTLTLTGDNTGFAGTYDCENGNMIFACPTSGLANLIDNAYVGFTSAFAPYAFGNLSDNGSGTSTLDLTNAGTVTFTTANADTFSGSVVDNGSDNLSIAGSGSLDFTGDVAVNGGLSVAAGTTVTFDNAAAFESTDVFGNIFNNSNLYFGGERRRSRLTRSLPTTAHCGLTARCWSTAS